MRASALRDSKTSSRGAEYTTYDYDTFRAIYGKLFVIASFLQNLAPQSIMTTVDKEVALSDQIIRFPLEKVERIDHPKSDAAWRRTRREASGATSSTSSSCPRTAELVVIGESVRQGAFGLDEHAHPQVHDPHLPPASRRISSAWSRASTPFWRIVPKGTFFAGVFHYICFYEGTFAITSTAAFPRSCSTRRASTSSSKCRAKASSGFVGRRSFLSPGSSSCRAARPSGLHGRHARQRELRGEALRKERLRSSIPSRLALSSTEITSRAMVDFHASRSPSGRRITLFVMKWIDSAPPEHWDRE